MTTSAQFTHSRHILQSPEAKAGRRARRVVWVVWVLAADATGFELDAEGPNHAQTLAQAWVQPDGIGGGRVAVAELRWVDHGGHAHPMGACYPLLCAQASQCPGDRQHVAAIPPRA